jgi:hypothetical protein
LKNSKGKLMPETIRNPKFTNDSNTTPYLSMLLF